MLVTIYSIMQLFFSSVWGRVSDRVGRRPILILSLTGSTTCYFLFGLATMWGSLAGMFLTRLVGGIVGATIPTAQAYIADVTPPEKRTRGMVIIGMAFGVGFTLGPLLGAIALSAAADAHLSPWPGFTAAVFSATALLLAIFRLQESLSPAAASAARSHFDLAALRGALAVPSIPSILVLLFLCDFGFAAFEGTLSLALRTFLGIERGGSQILFAFAYIGLVQTIVQGGLVRWLTGFTSDAALSLTGAALAIVGYVGLALAARPVEGGALALMLAASLVVSGLGFIYPSAQGMLSRRSDPSKQGGVLGIRQSMSSLARITGILVAMPLSEVVGQPVPFWLSAALMVAVIALVWTAARGGSDWQPSHETHAAESVGAMGL